MYAVLRAYGEALRQKQLLDLAYPMLAERSMLWSFLTGGHPEQLSPVGRYVLFAYRAASERAEQCAEWLHAQGCGQWLAAVEGETTFMLAHEWATLPVGWAPIIPEFQPTLPTLAVA